MGGGMSWRCGTFTVGRSVRLKKGVIDHGVKIPTGSNAAARRPGRSSCRSKNLFTCPALTSDNARTPGAGHEDVTRQQTGATEWPTRTWRTRPGLHQDSDGSVPRIPGVDLQAIMDGRRKDVEAVGTRQPRRFPGHAGAGAAADRDPSADHERVAEGGAGPMTPGKDPGAVLTSPGRARQAGRSRRRWPTCANWPSSPYAPGGVSRRSAAEEPEALGAGRRRHIRPSASSSGALIHPVAWIRCGCAG